MKTQRSFRSGLLLSLGGLVLSAVSGAFPTPARAAERARPESTKLSVGLAVPALSYLPCWVADQKGFLKEEGITDVKVLAFRGDADVLQALTGGTIDVSVSSLTGLVTSIKSGQKFKGVWAGYNQPYFEWYANPKFKSIAETKGGRYAVTKYGALTDFLTRYALRKAGLDPEKDVKILQLGGSPQSLAAMEAGQIEATILSAPSTYIAAEKGFVKIMDQNEYIAPDWPLHVIFAKEEYLAAHPNTIKAFLRANGRAMEWIRANPEEAAQIASKVTKFKVEHCRTFIKEWKDFWFADGRLPDKGMKVFWELAMQAGDVTEPWPNSRWLDGSYMATQNQWRK
ncbi:MAG: ABC transporter substrate-binding protein [Deltaproteobacteria bacterium]|nr:ABC transporter substrate-binding protein [Deltaproteobacteria bacterium]